MNSPGRSTADAHALRAHVVVAREHFAVDVNVEVAAGESVAIMGPSGAGKSTLLQALAGLLPLTAGAISIGGRVVDRIAAPQVHTAPMDRGVVLLGQDARLFPHLSARENVAFGPRAGGIARRSAQASADEWLTRVGLPGAGDRMPRELSGGERQRVAVARALAASPRAVLLDEPLVALDTETAGEIRNMLRDQLAGTTTVAVTHDATDAIALAERLVVIESGRVTQVGPVREVLTTPASGFVAAIAGLNRIVGVVRDGAWHGDGMTLPHTSAGGSAIATPDGTTLAALFRPEDVRIVGDEAATAHSWRTVVRSLEPTLSGMRVYTTECKIDVPLTDAAMLVPGMTVRLQIDPAALRFVPTR